MKHAVALVLTSALAAAMSSQGIAAQKTTSPKSTTQKTTTQKTTSQKTAAKTDTTADVSAPIAVEVVAVDPQANTITVRDIVAVPAPPGKPVEITLPVAVPPASTGQKIGDVTTGEQVAVTCAIKPTVHPTTGVPIVLTDCARVIKIEPKQ